MVPRILVIAGSDSGGGAGIQADIKTITMLGGHAMTAVTAITAQNTLGVQAVHPIPTAMVLAQIDSVLSDIGADAVKIGMIGSAETAHAVAERLGGLDVPIVFDPVMVATSGSVLADAATIAAFERLMGMAALITPNAPELAAVTGVAVEDEAGLGRAAQALAKRIGGHVLAKGGHLPGERLPDLLVTPEGVVHRWESTRIDTVHAHGTGCTLASAIAVHVARRRPLAEAVERARGFVRRAMLAAPGLGAGHGPMGHGEAGGDETNLNQVTLPAADYEVSVAFYRALGLRQIVDAPGRYARFECPGGATLSIHVEQSADAGGAAVYLESGALDAWVRQLIAAGIAFDALPQDQSWGWREAHLRDPAGNRLILYHGAENRRFPPWRIKDED
jgi:hydroxymethylpyrimidine/phosphomethylpyrimidine kinase